ncbi:MAG: methyltransferase domain-containing protein [Patescibacteria group bacterium]
MSEISKGWENQVYRPYSELKVSNPEDLDTWGNAFRDGELINAYTDERLIADVFTKPISAVEYSSEEPFLLADFGSAEGYVAYTVSTQLQSNGIQVQPIGLDSNSKSLELMKQRFPSVRGIEADLSNISLDQNSIDAGILRFTLPYFGEKAQPLVLQQINRVLKNGGRVVISHDGAYSDDLGSSYNQFFAEATAAVMDKPIEVVKASRHFPSCEALQRMANLTGYKIADARDLTEDVVSFLSPEAYASRFSMTEAQQDNLHQVFETWKNRGVLPFDPQTLRVRRPMYSCVLDK